MDRKSAAKLWPLIKAYSEGADIEYQDSPSVEWQKAPYPSFGCKPERYRIAPKKPRTGDLKVSVKQDGTFVQAVELYQGST